MARGAKATDRGVRVFRYPLSYRVVLFIGVILLGGYCGFAITVIVSARQAFWFPVAPMFLFALLNCWLLWTLLVRIDTDADGMTFRRLGTRRRLLWREVQQVRHRPRSASVVITGSSAKLRVHRQLQGFLAFYKVLRASVPPEAIEPPLEVPFTVAVSMSLRVVLGVGFVLFGFLAVSGLLRGSVLGAMVFGGAAALCLYLFAMHAPLRFEFGPDTVTAVYLGRSAAFRVADLTETNLSQRRAEIVLRMRFGRKQLELSDSQVLIAPERIEQSVAAAYGAPRR